MDGILVLIPARLRRSPVWAGAALLVITVVAISVIALLGHAAASNATFTVNDCSTFGDAHSAGTLAYELAAENASPSAAGDTIAFACGPGQITIVVPTTLVVSHDLHIAGDASSVTLSGGDAVRVFSVSAGAHLTLSGLTVAHGKGTGISIGEGGAILNAGTLTVNDCTFEVNVADGANGDGGAVSNEGGSVTITNTTFANNTALGTEVVGGALYTRGGTLEISSSTFSGNTAQADGHAFGGGVGNQGGTVTITNSTFSGNSAQGPGPATADTSFGGGLNNLDGTTTLVNDTFAGNAAQGSRGGGNIYFNNGQFSLTNTILAGSLNTTNCGGAYPLIADGGYNLADQGAAGCNLSAGRHDVVDATTPGLGTLADNGGPTHTVALLPTSPAVGAGNGSACPAVDQRGVSRQGATCDIGAYQLVVATTTSVAGSPAPSQFGHTVSLIAHVTGSSGPGAPSGSVTFMDGTATLGSGMISGGDATLATSALAPGSHQITAHYVGDGRFAPSSSSAFGQAVYELLGTTVPTATSTISGTTPANQQIALTIPAGATGTAITITGNPPDNVPHAPASDSLVGPTLLIAVQDGAGHDVGTLDLPATLTVSYDAGAISATDAYRLVIAEYLSSSGSWVLLDTSLDGAQHTLSASLSAFGEYSVLEVPAVPPTTDADLSATPNANGWLNHPVTVMLSATGGTGGAAGTYYSVDDASCAATSLTSCTLYTAPFPITGAGVHTVYFFSEARAGVAESRTTMAVRLDFTAPTSHLDVGFPHVSGSTIFVAGATPITITAADETGGSGVQSVMHCVTRTGGTCAYVATTAPFTIAGPDGTYEIDYFATDKAGNVEAVHKLRVTLDTTAPSTTLTASSATPTDATVFHLAASDAGSGVSAVAYRFYATGSAAPAYTSVGGGTADFALGGQPAGDYVIEFYATDALGNREATQIRVVTLVNNDAGGQAPATPTPSVTDTPAATATTGSPTGGAPAAAPPPGGSSGLPTGWVIGGIALALLVLLYGVLAIVLARRAAPDPPDRTNSPA